MSEYKVKPAQEIRDTYTRGPVIQRCLDFIIEVVEQRAEKGSNYAVINLGPIEIDEVREALEAAGYSVKTAGLDPCRLFIRWGAVSSSATVTNVHGTFSAS